MLARGWRGGGGEIDLVAARGGVLALCEVKARSEPEALVEPVTARQRARIARAAAAWLARHPPPPDTEVRLDLLTVLLGGRRAVVRHLPGALGEEGRGRGRAQAGG